MDATIAKIEEYAELFMSVDKISFLCEIDADEFRREVRCRKHKHMSERAKAYHRGKLRTDILIRKQALELAKAGSPQAEQLMLEYSDQQNSNE